MNIEHQRAKLAEQNANISPSKKIFYKLHSSPNNDLMPHNGLKKSSSMSKIGKQAMRSNVLDTSRTNSEKIQELVQKYEKWTDDQLEQKKELEKQNQATTGQREVGWRVDLRAEMDFKKKKTKPLEVGTLQFIDRISSEPIHRFNQRSVKDLSPLSKMWTKSRNPIQTGEDVYNNKNRNSLKQTQFSTRGKELFAHLNSAKTISYTNKIEKEQQEADNTNYQPIKNPFYNHLQDKRHVRESDPTKTVKTNIKQSQFFSLMDEHFMNSDIGKAIKK